MSMKKAELVERMAKNANITKAAAEKALDGFTGAVEDALKNGDSLTLVGFGTFSLTERAAREGRNPQTGQTMQIPAAKVPKFKAGKGLKDAVA
jgi:DNA-binding protein HU-beta